MISNFQSVGSIFVEELVQGNIVKHFTGDVWEVYTEPKYTQRGVTFEVLPMNSDAPVFEVVFAPGWRFELVVEQVGQILVEDQIVVPEIEVDNAVEFKGDTWRVSAMLKNSDTVLIENLKRIERRYVKVNVLKFVHFDYREYLKIQSIQIDSVVKIESTLYRVVQRDGDKLILENGGGINCAAYVGEVEFVHKNYQEYALLPIQSEAAREYSWRLTQVACDICDAADKLAISLKIYEQMTDNIPKSIDIQVMWATSDGKLAPQQLLDAVDSFEIALNEYQEV
jgi:hypothetical protein